MRRRATPRGSDPGGGVVTISRSGSIFVSDDDLPGLREVTDALAPVTVTIAASWLTLEQRELDGLTPIEWLREGRDQAFVVRAARRFALDIANPS
jgi:hypothetical protein